MPSRIEIASRNPQSVVTSFSLARSGSTDAEIERRSMDLVSLVVDCRDMEAEAIVLLLLIGCWIWPVGYGQLQWCSSLTGQMAWVDGGCR